MTYVITKMCRDCKDISCVEVCPVDCIYEYTGDDESIPKSQLLIDPEECIDCNACEPECPWEAIFADEDLPETFSEDLEINARIAGQDDRIVPEIDEEKPPPNEEQLKENKQKWGYED